jgi:hypothetical protein
MLKSKDNFIQQAMYAIEDLPQAQHNSTAHIAKRYLPF